MEMSLVVVVYCRQSYVENCSESSRGIWLPQVSCVSQGPNVSSARQSPGKAHRCIEELAQAFSSLAAASCLVSWV